ncbi:MAG: histidine kinase dimerization/phosphoacceptor domain -containing protein, partial [Bacteroidota bacterium]
FSINNPIELPDRMRAFKLAIATFNKGGYTEQEAYAYKMLAETDSSDITTEDELNKSLALYNSIQYQQLQGVYDLFASLYIYRSNFPEALKWGLKALKTAEAVGDSSMQLCEINNHIAITYDHSHDSTNAITYYTAALRIAERYDDKNTIYLLTHNIAFIYTNRQQPLPARDLLLHIQIKYGAPDKRSTLNYYRFMGDFLKVYTLLKQFRQGEPYFIKLTEIENQDQFVISNLSDVYVNILDYLLASGQYSRMLPYLKKDEALAKAYGNPRNMYRLQQLWFSYDTSQHNYKSAVDHMLQFHKLYSTINTEARERSLKELQVQFDTRKKEDQIVLLSKESLLEKSNLKQATLIKNMTIAGIIFALIIAGILYRQSRLRKKNNTVITQKNEQLQHLLSEKEWLVKEIHHRVKNNFQTVMGLLGTQSAFLKNEEAINAMNESQNRIQAMSLIHQRLYQSNNLSAIRMNDYIHELADSLSDSFNRENRISFVMDIDPVDLSLIHCIPLGLILNEAITNSFKYAFPGNQRGEIAISLKNTSNQHLLLSIKDNGTGLTNDLAISQSNSMGMNLMRGLSAEIDAVFTIRNENGTRIDVQFPYKIEIPGSDTTIQS